MLKKLIKLQTRRTLMLSSFGHKNIAVFSLTVITVLISAGCSSSGDNASSGKAAAQQGESGFELVSYFTEARPKVRLEKKQTCHGENLSPPLSWSKAPNGTVSFALIAEDVDHETGSWVHWVVYNIPGDVTKLAAGISTSTSKLPDGTTQGSNDFKNNGYEGPCPTQVIIAGVGEGYDMSKGMMVPSGAAHKYQFTIYALGENLDLEPGATKSQLLKSMERHILGRATRTGKYQLPVGSGYKKELGRNMLGGFGKLATTTPQSTK